MSEKSDETLLQDCYEKTRAITKSNNEILLLQKQVTDLMEQLDKATKPRYAMLHLENLAKEKRLRFAAVI